MADLTDLGRKIGITSPRVFRKAKEYYQLLDIRSNSGSLSALKLTGSCRSVTCLDLAASSCNHHIDRANAARVSGTSKKQYTMILKTIESVLDIEEMKTVRDIAVQFGCTGAITLAQKILQRYEKTQGVQGDDMDYNTSLFQSAALCSACRKQKIRIDRGKVKELCAVKKSCFDTLVAEMDKIADKIEGETKVSGSHKRGTSLLDEVERRLQEDVPEKKQCTEQQEGDEKKTDYEAWKRKILENAAKANTKS